MADCSEVYVVCDYDGEPVGVFTDLGAAKIAADKYAKTQSYCVIKALELNAACEWHDLDRVVYDNWPPKQK